MAANVLGGGVVVVAAAGVAAHYSGSGRVSVILVASFAPFFALLAVAVAVPLLALRCWIAAACAVLVAAVGVAQQVPLFIGQEPVVASGTPQVRVLQANILFGKADPAALVDIVERERVDVLTVSELTAPAVQGLRRAGLDDLMPFSFAHPRDGGGGTGIFSRFPLSDGELLPGFVTNNLVAVAEVPGAAPFAVYAVHVLPPNLPPFGTWSAELTQLRSILDRGDRPLIVGGDFNATYDHERFRDLFDSGSLVDVADHLGAGIVATYPAGRLIPPVLAIDRILTRDLTPASIRRIPLAGSDHMGVIADIALNQPVGG